MTSFQDAPDEIVRMSNNLRFVLVDIIRKRGITGKKINAREK